MANEEIKEQQGDDALVESNSADEAISAGESRTETTPEENFRLFIGPNPDKFIKAAGVGAGGKQSTTFNWPAFFIGPIWLFYRKLYLWGACLLLVPVVLVVIFPQLSKVSFGYGVLLGLLGHKIYMNHATSKIGKIKKLDLSDDEFKDRLKKAGGTSPAGAVFGVVITVALIVLPILGAMAETLPMCSDAELQALASETVSNGLSQDGVSVEGLKIANFKEVDSKDVTSKRICSFTAEYASQVQLLYMAVTWADKEIGQYQINITSDWEKISE